MKVAYLIQCHKNAEQVNRLIKALNSDALSYCTDFYVHVDAKSNIASEIIDIPNVNVLHERVNVRWGHVSQVQATLKLIEKALESKIDYDYLWLISGQDYPIKSNSYIYDFLATKGQKNYIEIIDKGSDQYRRYLKRNQTWFPTWGASPVFVMRVLRKIYVILTGGARHSIIKRKNVLNAEWQFGSQWWTLTKDACRYILEKSADGSWIDYYKNCLCSDESYFQTMLYNSEFKETIAGYNLCYVDWSEGKKNPKLLNEKDLPALQASDKLLARKLEQGTLMDSLDQINEKDEDK